MKINPNTNLSESFEKFKRGVLQARAEINDPGLPTSERLINAYTTLKCYSDMLLDEVEVKEQTEPVPTLTVYENNKEQSNDDIPGGLFQQQLNWDGDGEILN